MEMTFRWFGPDDPVTLENIRQIPGMAGVVSSIYDVPVGEAWPPDEIRKLKERVEDSGLSLEVIESVPVHEDIKLGGPARDRYIDNYRMTLENLAQAKVPVVCYNFMPVFDWTRTQLDYRLPDGSTALVYEEDMILQMDPSPDKLNLPGWDASVTSWRGSSRRRTRSESRWRFTQTTHPGPYWDFRASFGMRRTWRVFWVWQIAPTMGSRSAPDPWAQIQGTIFPR